MGELFKHIFPVLNNNSLSSIERSSMIYIWIWTFQFLYDVETLTEALMSVFSTGLDYYHN